MSDPAEDKALEEYLLRKSALSMGYKKVYVEAPPPELDRAITARARRALRWLVPGLLAVGIALLLVVGLNVGVNNWMGAMVAAERNVKKIREERKAQEEQERLKQPVTVMIDAGNLPKQDAEEAAAKQKAMRDAWLAEIEELKREGKTATAETEMKRFKATYPDRNDK